MLHVLAKAAVHVGFPVGPHVVDRWATFPLAPGQHHVATHLGMLGTGGDHGLVGDGDSSIGGKDLTFSCFLVKMARGRPELMPE